LLLALLVLVGWGYSARSAEARAAEGVAAAATQPGGDAVTPAFKLERAEVEPGTNTVVAIELKMRAGFHVWPNKPELPPELKEVEPIATTLTLKSADAGLTVYSEAAQWPKGKPVPVNFTGSELELISLSDGAVIFVPVKVAESAAAGPLRFTLTVSYQACNETTCFQPRSDELSVELTVVAAGQVIAAQIPDPVFKEFDPSVWSRIASGDIAAGGGTEVSMPAGTARSSSAEGDIGGAAFDFLGVRFSVDSVALVLLISFAAGVLMNFTPCVLPVIPLKINALQHQAHSGSGGSGKVVLFGALFCAGIMAVFGLIAVLALTLNLAFGQWFSYWYVTIPLALIIAVLGLGMLGLFDISLPQVVYSIAPTHESATGNFLMGVLTAVLSTPCTGPMFGAAFGYAVKQSPTLATTLILTMGAGMAAPYVLLIAFPALVKKLPRGGPGGALLKQVLGLFMLAVAAYIASNIFPGKWPFYVVGALAAVAALWWVIGALRQLKSPAAKAINVALALLTLAACVPVTLSLTSDGPFAWVVRVAPADAALREEIALAVKSGRGVVVDFTAKWCTNCLVIEKTILNSDEGVRILEAYKPLALKVDLTSAGSDQGWGVQRDISGGGGLPLIAVYGPKLTTPIYFQSFFKTSDLEAALKEATGR